MTDQAIAELQAMLETLRQEQQRLQEELDQRSGELERVRMERDRSRALVELAADAIFTGDTSGHFIGCNQSATELTGYLREELLSMDMSQLFSEEERLRAPLRYDALREGKVVQTERLLTRKDGSTVPIEMNSKMMPDGTFHAFIRDVTQRKELEQVILDSVEHQRALSEATFEAVVLTQRGICIGQNTNTEKLFGYSAKETIGKLSTLLIAPEERERVKNKIDSGYDFPYETIGLTRDGRRFPVEIQGREMSYRGQQIRVAAIRDITSQKQAERDLQIIQKLESIGTLAGGLAHDFNNILTGLFGNLSLAKLHIAEQHPAFRFINQAEKSLNRATHLTGKLLTFAKGGEPIREQVALCDLVRETVEFDLAGSNVKLLLESDDDLWQAEVDRGQIQQVFSNLAINANQAMADGGHLRITLRNYNHQGESQPGLAEGRYILAEVRDEGVGISRRHLGRVFDPYFSTKESGRGLGLASVYSIISKHKGVISVSSQPGDGTIFTVYLPASSLPAAEPSADLVEAARTPEVPPRVLVMDDDLDVSAIVREMLQRMHCQVMTVENGFRAMEVYRAAAQAGQGFDLVILDLTVPGGGGGKETAGWILTVNPGAKIVVSSGYTEDPVMANYADYGFAAVVPKPYVYEQLQQVVSRVLNGSAEV